MKIRYYNDLKRMKAGDVARRIVSHDNEDRETFNIRKEHNGTWVVYEEGVSNPLVYDNPLRLREDLEIPFDAKEKIELSKMAKYLEKCVYRAMFLEQVERTIFERNILEKLMEYKRVKHITSNEAKEIVENVFVRLNEYADELRDVSYMQYWMSFYVKNGYFKDEPKEEVKEAESETIEEEIELVEQEEAESETIEEEIELVEQEEAESEAVKEDEKIELIEHSEEPKKEDEINILIVSDVDVIPLLRPFEKIKPNDLNNATLKIEYLESENIIVPSLRFSDFDVAFVSIDRFNVDDLPAVNPKEIITPIIAICTNWDVGIEAKKNGAKDFIFAPLDPPEPKQIVEIIEGIRNAKTHPI